MGDALDDALAAVPCELKRRVSFAFATAIAMTFLAPWGSAHLPLPRRAVEWLVCIAIWEAAVWLVRGGVTRRFGGGRAGGGADILSRLSADAGACVRPRRAVVHACYQRDRRHLRRLCPVLCRCDAAGIHSGRYSLWDMGAAVCDTGWCFRRACAGAGAWRGWRVVLRFPWTPCPGSGGGEAARARGGGSLSADSYRQGAGAGAAASARCDRQSGRRGGATGASFVLGAMHAAPRAARRGQSWQLELPSGLSIPVSKARVAACRAVGWL